MKTGIDRLALAALLLTCGSSFAEEVRLDVVHRIKEQAFEHSQVMDYLHLLADLNGPRLTASPGYHRAAEAAIGAFREAGVGDARLEPWGVFGRGWSWSRIAVQMKQPHETTLAAIPADYSSATDGPVAGEVVFAPLWEGRDDPDAKDLEKVAHQIEAYRRTHRGKLTGKVVMIDHPVPFRLPEKPPRYRFDDAELAELEQSNEPGAKPPLEWPLIRTPVDRDEASRFNDTLPLEVAADRWLMQLGLGVRMASFLREEGVAAVLLSSYGRMAGVIKGSDYGSYRDGDPAAPPTAVLLPEQYSRIHRLVERDVPVVVSVEVDAEFYGPGIEGTNVIAEIPGTRGDEVVMLGAHLDSWHGATGATDNGTGTAVVMEVMRILAALDLEMPRTVRAALWDGEEQCLCGSRGYVAKHFGDPVTMTLKPEHAAVSAYFNLDNGGGRIRGVHLQRNDMARPILEAWLAPFADLGATATTIVNTRGTDHLSFDAVGLPGFNFVQDPLDYRATHHSNVDDVSHVIPGDLMQAAAVMATAVYHAASRPELMPRKTLPAPLPPKQPLPEILRTP